MRMMVAFQKGYALRFIGHLDLMRTVQRGLRRSDLPIMYSNGFNPHIKLSFAAPLSVGVTGHHELMEVPFAEEITPAQFLSQMNAVMPPDFQMVSCRILPEKFPTLMSLVAGSIYQITMDKNDITQSLIGQLEAFMALPECLAMRKTKSGINECDIRPYVREATVASTADHWQITLHTAQLQSGALKPSLWMECFCRFANVDPVPCLIARESILAKDDTGAYVPLEELSRG